MADEILTLREVASYLKVSDKTVYRLAQRGKIPALKVGGSWRFRRDDILTWLDESVQAGAGREAGEK